MSQKNKQQLQEELKKLEEAKLKLEEAKAKKPEAWTQQMQVKLDELVGEIADINEDIAKFDQQDKKEEQEEQKSGYVPEKGTENHIHLKIVKGRRFNPMTGKEESNPYLQIFNTSEFRLFKENARSLGYSVLEVLHDPTGEAKEMLVK